MIFIKKEIFDQILKHAIKELPNEACGYLAGNGDRITEHYALTNIDRSPEHFSFDPKEQFATVKDARSKGLTILANYHSHPSTPARPSEEDIKLAYDPSILYIIISLVAQVPDIKAFRIIKGEVQKEEITIE